MLSDFDRRQLDAIERELWSDDPVLAYRLTGWPSASTSRWTRWAAITMAMVCILGVLAGIVLLDPALTVIPGLGLVGAVAWLWRRRRRDRRRPAPDTRPDKG